METNVTNRTEEALLAENRRSAAQVRVTAAHLADEEAVGRLFQAVVWGYFGSAVSLLALALWSLSGAHVHWIHLARGIVTGS